MGLWGPGKGSFCKGASCREKVEDTTGRAQLEHR